MSKKKVAPLKINKHDASDLAFDILNNVFQENSSSDQSLLPNEESSLENPDELPEYIDLDDWNYEKFAETQEQAKKCDSRAPSSNNNNKIKCEDTKDKTMPMKNDNVESAELARLREADKVLSSNGHIRDTSGSKLGHMFTSREYDEDSILHLRFKKREVPASKIKELASVHRLVPLAGALQHSGSKFWFTTGVITEYAVVKSKRGCRVDLTDLAQNPYNLRVLLFDTSFSKFEGKLLPGSIVCIINATKGKPYNGKEPLIVNNFDQVMIAGSSRDYGLCGAKKKAGGLCGAAVNLSICRYCSFHAMSEYKEKGMSKDLRDAMGGSFGAALNNKKPNNSTGIKYSNMKSGRRTAAQSKKDQDILYKLSTIPPLKKTQIQSSNINSKQSIEQQNNDKKSKKAGDSGNVSSKLSANRMIPQFSNATKAIYSEVTANSSSNVSLNPPKRKISDTDFDKKETIAGPGKTPDRNAGFLSNMVAFNSSKCMSAAKKRALAFASKSGGISPVIAKKKPVSPPEEKKPKDLQSVITPEFMALMTAEPSNAAILAAAEGKERDKRFEKLQVIEEVGEKLSKTHEVPVRVVRCLVCNKNYQKMPLDCLQKNHKCRIVKGTKRFFECLSCRNRMSTIERLPLTECGKCGGCSWKRAGMASDKVCRSLHQLSVRGNEEKFMGSIVTDPNLSLLVPDEP